MVVVEALLQNINNKETESWNRRQQQALQVDTKATLIKQLRSHQTNINNNNNNNNMNNHDKEVMRFLNQFNCPKLLSQQNK